MPINCYEFQLCRASEACGCKQKAGNAASLYSADWLRRSIRNPAVLTALRGVAKTGGTIPMDNESIVRLIAGQIASGQLRVCQTQSAKSGAAGDPGTTAAKESSKPFPFEPKPKTSSPSPQSASDPPTLPENTDAAAQAAALSSAANQGAPFCPE